MKTILWISRHNMTADQMADLERIMGEVRLLPWRDTVEDVADLAPLLAQADAVAAVLPPEMLSRLLALAGDRPVLQAVSWRQPTGRMRPVPGGGEEPEFAFVHRCWQQVLRLEIETRIL